ncbi:acylcarnitine hydrolase-like [Brevipalpus obovatus]|uniref:acylcarnitine hydrolase-like n=1 Tax=Brevipalpus obovatus TaxID=246614 RepID=UPI003D9EFFC2
MNSSIILCIFCILCVIPASYLVTLTPKATTTEGPVVGFVDQVQGRKVYNFYGIPYAKPPVGQLRFAKTVAVEARKDVYEAISYSSDCYHFVDDLRDINIPISEDCLYLNIITTEDAFMGKDKAKRHVMFYIHGGGFTRGSGTQYPFLSQTLVSTQDIVLVTHNYRLDVFGFIYHEKMPEFRGNYGLWDQNMALRWVKNNIAHFGGDPNQITIFGESVGGLSTFMHIASPYASGLFNRAIPMSAVPLLLEDEANYRTSLSSEIVLKRSGCMDAKDKLICLRSIPAEQLALMVPLRELPFGVVYNSEYVPVKESQLFLNGSYSNDVDVMVGLAEEDASFFFSYISVVPYIKQNLTYRDGLQVIGLSFKPEAVNQVAQWYLGDPKKVSSYDIQQGLIQIANDISFGVAYEVARRNAVQQRVGKTYGWLLTRAPKVNFQVMCFLDKDFGVCHEDILIYVFGVPFDKAGFYKDSDRLLSAQLMDVWGNFAKTGKTLWAPWKVSGNGNSDTPLAYFEPSKDGKSSFEIGQNPAKRIIERFDFFKKNLLPKLFGFDKYPIQQQIPIDKKSDRRKYWPIYLPYLTTEHFYY